MICALAHKLFSVMADQYPNLSTELIKFIEEQHIFFVATAAPEGRINLSPKGQDSLRVINASELLWLNLTGSGNETAAHLLETPRITMMWCAFQGPPNIVRVYGSAQAIHQKDPEWQDCTDVLPPVLGARQYLKVNIDLVQTSCGYAVPLMDYQEDRQVLSMWAEKRGPQGIEDYWAEKNQVSLDGKPTGILD